MRAVLLFLAGMISGIMLVASGAVPLSFDAGMAEGQLVVMPVPQPSVQWHVRFPVARGLRLQVSSVVVQSQNWPAAHNSSADGQAAAGPAVAHVSTALPTGADHAAAVAVVAGAPVMDTVGTPGTGDESTPSISDHQASRSLPVAATATGAEGIASHPATAAEASHDADGLSIRPAGPGQANGADLQDAVLPAAPPAAMAQYEQAMETYQAGKFSLSRRLFARFMHAHPGHALFPNALYWTGETWYDEHRFAAAADAFQQVVNLYPRHRKSADALLKMAYCAEQRGDMDGARILLHRLLAAYPKSDASRLGRQAMKKMQGRRSLSGQVIARG